MKILVADRISPLGVEFLQKQDGFEVVDWKTGSKQLGESAAIQLAMYRLAWARLKKIDVSKVSAAFHYVPTSVTDRRADLLDESALVALIQKYNK